MTEGVVRADSLIKIFLNVFWVIYSCILSPQCCDLGYHASLARTFRTYLSAEYNLETSRHEGLDIIENAVDNLDSRSDKHKIMDMHNQVFCPPMRFEYLPHMGDEVRCFKWCSSNEGFLYHVALKKGTL